MSEWGALLVELGEHEPSFALVNEARARAARQGAPTPPGRWAGRFKLGLAIAIGAAVIAAVLLVLALAAQSRSSNRPAHRPQPSTATAQEPAFREAPAAPPPAAEPDGRFGEPVDVAGMTFVVKRLTAVPSVQIPDDPQPLEAPPGSRLWVLTVRVRNDGRAVERDPFCRGHGTGRDLHRLGAELVSNHPTSYLPWSKQSLSIPDNLCTTIEPGVEKTFTVLFTMRNHEAKIAGVLLDHRAPEAKKFTFVFVAR